MTLTGKISRAITVGALVIAVMVTVAFVVGLTGDSQPDAAEFQRFAGGCAVGSPAALDAPRVPPGSRVRLESEVLVLGCKNVKWHGLLQLVGFRTSQGVCAAADSPRERDSAGIVCLLPKSTGRSFCESAVCAGPLSWSEGSLRNGYSKMVGQVSPRADRVEVRFVDASGVGRRIDAVVDQARGTVLSRLGAEREFGVFAAVLPGCPPESGAKVVAKDEAGHTIGVARTMDAAPGFCKAHV